MQKDKKKAGFTEGEPLVYVGFSELGDEDYEKEKEVHCPKKGKERKKSSKGQKSAMTDKNLTIPQLLGTKRGKDEDIKSPEEKKMKKLKESKQELNENNNSQLVALGKEVFSLEKVGLNKMEKMEVDEEKKVQVQLPSSDKLKSVFSRINNTTGAQAQTNSKTNDNEKDIMHNSPQLNNDPSMISLEVFPQLQQSFYFIKDLDFTVIPHSYHSIKDILMKRSDQIKKVLTDKKNHNIIQLSLSNLPELLHLLEKTLGSTKLWYDRSSDNMLSLCSFDVIGLTIAKAVLLPELTIHHLSNCDVINFRTVLVNLGPGTLTHSIISKDAIQSYQSYCQTKHGANCLKGQKSRSIAREFIVELSLPYQSITQQPHTVIVLEPGMIHWSKTANAPSLFVYWSLFQENSAEYNAISLIHKHIASLHQTPSVPLLALKLDVLTHSLDTLPLDSVKCYYYEMQNIINAHSLESFKLFLIKEKVGLMQEPKETQLFFCDSCHNEIFNYYSVSKRRKEAYCLQCLCINAKEKPMKSKLLFYKHSQQDLDGFLNKMKEKMISCYQSNSISIDNKENFPMKKAPIDSMRSLGFQKRIFKRNVEPLIRYECFDSYLYSYETYSPYEEKGCGLNADLVSNYLIHLIDKDKEKPAFSKSLSLSNTRFPYSDFEDLTDDINLLRFSPSYRANPIQKPKEAKNVLSSMLVLQEKSNGASVLPVSVVSNKSNNKLHNHLTGASIFDFAKKVVSDSKEVKSKELNGKQQESKRRFQFDDDIEGEFNA